MMTSRSTAQISLATLAAALALAGCNKGANTTNTVEANVAAADNEAAAVPPEDVALPAGDNGRLVQYDDHGHAAPRPQPSPDDRGATGDHSRTGANDRGRGSGRVGPQPSSSPSSSRAAYDGTQPAPDSYGGHRDTGNGNSSDAR
jgi:hypothetical protein